MYLITRVLWFQYTSTSFCAKYNDLLLHKTKTHNQLLQVLLYKCMLPASSFGEKAGFTKFFGVLRIFGWNSLKHEDP